MKPFDLDAAKRGKKIITRDGREAKFVAHVPEADENSRVIFLAPLGDNKLLLSVCEIGLCAPDADHANDLFMAPPKERVVWANLLSEGFAYYFGTEAEAVAEQYSGWEVKARAVPVTILVEE